MNSALGSALVIMLGIQCLLFLTQMAVSELGSETVFYDCKDTIIGGLEANNCQGSSYLLNDSKPAGVLPSGASTVSVETGNIFTDGFSAIKSWFLDLTGLSYLQSFLTAPSTVLKSIGLPSAFVFAVSAFWYGIMIFLIVAFFIGRDV